jgi:hypothetical protein
MGAPPGQQEGVVASIVSEYVRGLCWVMRYYYEGVASWEWCVVALCVFVCVCVFGGGEGRAC